MSTVITNKKTTEIVAMNLRHLLDEQGMSLRELARKTGDSAVTMSNIINGKHVAGVGIMARIAEALGVTVDEFLKEKQRA